MSTYQDPNQPQQYPYPQQPQDYAHPQQYPYPQPAAQSASQDYAEYAYAPPQEYVYAQPAQAPQQYAPQPQAPQQPQDYAHPQPPQDYGYALPVQPGPPQQYAYPPQPGPGPGPQPYPSPQSYQNPQPYQSPPPQQQSQPQPPQQQPPQPLVPWHDPQPGWPDPGPPAESTLATVALWLGILGGWLVVNLFVALAAVRETGPGRKRGREKALIGLACSVVWAVVLAGVSFAVFHNDVTASAAPKPTFTNASDPGCEAAGAAVAGYRSTVHTDLRTADTNLGNALLAGAAKSHVAATELHRVGQDFLDLAGGTVDPTLNSDIAALNHVCGLEFTYGGSS